MATDETFDELISTWLQETAPAQISARVLEETAQRTRASRQEVRWRRLLRGIDISRSILVLAGTAVIVVAAVVALSPRVGQPEVGRLPTTPNAWSRVAIDDRWATAQVDGFVAGHRGLLAVLGETGSSDMQLAVSTDGRTWSLVPNDQFPSSDVLLPPQGGSHLPAVVTTQGFLFVAYGNDVWASEDGLTWQRRDDRARDEDLRAGTILGVAAGGPGLVAVGSDNTAWYSVDGSDWAAADVPAPPIESFAREGYAAPTVDMVGVAIAADTLVAWGNATAENGAGVKVEPVLWTSVDGRSWENVPDISGINWLQDVASGPGGFVAIGGAGVADPARYWFSADGQVWHPAEGLRFAEPSELSIAGTSAGYVAAVGEALCAVEPCPSARAVIFTSPDGLTWSRLPDDDRFEVPDTGSTANHSGAWATNAVAWDGQFVVAGAYDFSPVVWISGTPSPTDPPLVTPTPSSPPSTDAESAFLGVWVSTSDGDGGTQTMTVEPATDDSVETVVTDTIATVCSGTSSTMTGSGSVQGNTLVIPDPDYRCDDGTEATTPDGPPLNDQLRNLTYTYDAATDTLSVGIGDVWRREEATASTPAPQPSEQVPPWVEPTASGTPPLGAPGSGTPIGWSRDGTRILVQKDDQKLVLRHADGSETLVTEQPSEYERFLGSARPAGATISTDGSRVVFAGLTTTAGRSCHEGALLAVSADGGPAEVLWESQAVADGGIVRYPTFSPDGTRIAFADGYCDHLHSVWVMNADGTGAQQIVSIDQAGWVYGVAWSPSGDRIALRFTGVDYAGTYTFAPDGSDLTQGAASEYCWPGRAC